MDMNTYQDKALETAVYPKRDGLTYTMLGLAGEAGELLNKYKKVIRGDHELYVARESMVDELGDILWYVAAVANELGISLGTVGHHNILKLQARHEVHPAAYYLRKRG